MSRNHNKNGLFLQLERSKEHFVKNFLRKTNKLPLNNNFFKFKFINFRLGQQCLKIILDDTRKCFLKKHDVQICPKYDLLKFPNTTVQINKIETTTSKQHKKPTLRIPVILSKNTLFPK